MALRDLFDEDGLLRDAPLSEVDAGPVAVPWPATSAEIREVLGSASEARQRAYAHLAGFLDWFERSLPSDQRREVWLRGEFAATLRAEVGDLDLVVHYDGRLLSAGDSWVLSILAAGPINLQPGRMSVTALRHDAEAQYREDLVQERRRSMVRVQRREDGEQIRTGWLKIVSAEEVTDG